MSKALVGQEIAKLASDGDVIGIGTGSTVAAALEALQPRIENEQLSISAVTTSYSSTLLCQEIGISVLHPSFAGKISWGFDGADEIDPEGRIIKGQGGAMLKEKILAARCSNYIIVADDSKKVSRLGERCPVPIEVIPEAVNFVMDDVFRRVGAQKVELRRDAKDLPVLTECGNLILDASFAAVPSSFEDSLSSIVGVVETGLFIGYATKILIAGEGGVETLAPTRLRPGPLAS